MSKLYRNIKRLRIERGLSQDALAKLTGYTDRSSITKIEKGDSGQSGWKSANQSRILRNLLRKKKTRLYGMLSMNAHGMDKILKLCFRPLYSILRPSDRRMKSRGISSI